MFENDRTRKSVGCFIQPFFYWQICQILNSNTDEILIIETAILAVYYKLTF